MSLSFILASCEQIPVDGPGEENKPQSSITIHFSAVQYQETKAAAALPDTADFILTVTDSKGGEIYNGAYGKAPETLLVNAGTYQIKAVSEEFTKPAFASPQYGDEQTVIVKKGENVNVTLDCVQLNAGVRLKISPGFLTSYPDGVLYLRQGSHKLMYSYREKRTAYFAPGKVELLLAENAGTKVILARQLAAREILVLNISASSSSAESGSSMSIQVDTTRNWSYENFHLGNGGPGDPGGSTGGTGKSKNTALSVSQAISREAEGDVWVYGYIVGCCKAVNSFSTSAPFGSATNILISGKATFNSKESVIAVELRKGELRDALNLQDNPELFGSKVYVCGDLVDAYFGVKGLKAVTEYEF